MTADRRAKLVEKVARAIDAALPDHALPYNREIIATVAIDIIRAEVLEEAAYEAECVIAYGTSQAVMRENIAAAIRALKGKP